MPLKCRLPHAHISRQIEEVGFIADRLGRFLDNWSKITDDAFILGVVSGYKIPFKYKVTENLNNANRGYVDAEENKRLEIAIEKLVKKGAVVQCKAVKGQVLSS